MSVKNLEPLTPKELAVFNLLTTGLLYKEIALEQGVCIDTVKKHCKNIYPKLGVRNRTEATMLAIHQSMRDAAE